MHVRLFSIFFSIFPHFSLPAFIGKVAGHAKCELYTVCCMLYCTVQQYYAVYCVNMSCRRLCKYVGRLEEIVRGEVVLYIHTDTYT